MQELAKSISELVNSLNGGAKGLAEAMQRVAPDAWRIAVKQVVIDAVTGLVGWTLVAALICVLAYKFKLNEHQNYSWLAQEKKKPAAEQREPYISRLVTDANVWHIWTWVSAVSACVVLIAATCFHIPRLLNPQYEAASQLSARFLRK